MNNNDSQRKSIAFFIIAILIYFYLDTVLFPHFDMKPKSASPAAVTSTDGNLDTSKNESQLSNSAASKTVEQKSTTGNAVAGSLVNDAVINEDSFKEGNINITSPLFKARINKLGGRITSFKLKNFRKKDVIDPKSSKDLELFDMVSHRGNSPYPGGLYLGEESDIATRYDVQIFVNGNEVVTAENIELNDVNQDVKVVLKGKLTGSGTELEKSFSFNFDSYLYDVKAKDLSASSTNAPLSIEWVNQISLEEAGLLDTNNVIGFVWLDKDLAHRQQFAEMVKELEIQNIGCVKWVGLGDKYFATAIVSQDSFTENSEQNNSKEVCPKNTLPKAEIRRDDNVAFVKFTPIQKDNSIELKVYSGPKNYSTLSSQGFELKRLVDLGKTGFISAPLLLLLNFFNKFLNNYGLAIVFLTICVKLVLYPLNTTQFRQMKAHQALKPELDRIKENIKDKQQQQMAMMELYKKKGVNPLGGCLPAIVQMPIFIGLYSALMLAVELRHAPYGLWVHDLSAPDRLEIAGIGIPVLVVLFTLSIMVQQWITPSNIDPAQKKAMMFMPIIMFFMFMGFPAGLALYWLTNNLISIGQQQAIQYSDKSGKSGLMITLGVALVVFAIAYLGTLF